jgi:hypothetical protein
MLEKGIDYKSDKKVKGWNKNNSERNGTKIEKEEVK